MKELFQHSGYSEGGGKSPHLGRVLIVDDEAELMETLVEMIGSKGYLTKGFTSGESALETLRSEEFDLILTDLMMPKMDGIELLENALEIDPNIPGIIMTGQGTIQTAVEAMRAGAFDYILKPFKLEMLLPSLDRAIHVRRLKLENLHLRGGLAIYDLFKAVSLDLDRTTLINKVADAAQEQFEADEVSLMMPAEGSDELSIVVVRGDGRGHLLGESASMDRGIAGWVARNRETVILNGPVEEERFEPLYPREDIRSAISHPLVVGGKLVGVLNINATKRSRPFTLGEAKVLDMMCSTAASVLENTRLYENLRQAEEKYRSIYENATNGIFRISPDGRFMTANPALAKILGYESPEELIAGIGDLADELYVDPESHNRINGLLEENGRVKGFETRVRRKDGSEIWVSQNLHVVRDRGGEVTHLEGILEEITSRKEAEEEIRRSRESLQKILDSVPFGVFMVSMDKRILHANPAALGAAGYDSEEEIKGKSCYEVFSFSESHQCPILDVGEKVDTSERIIRTKEGREVPILKSVIIVDIDGEEVLLETFVDITERKAALEEVEWLARFPEENPRPVMRVSTDGVLLYANKAAAPLLGFYDIQVSQTVPQHWSDLCSQAFASEKNKEVEMNCGERTYAMTFSPIPDASYINVYALDITERKLAVEALAESQRTLLTLMGNLPGMAYRCINDPSWTMKFVSDGCLELTGYEPEDLIENRRISFGEIIHEDDRSVVREIVRTALDEGRPYQLEYRIIDARGDMKWIWERGVGTSSETAGHQELEGFIADITERRKAEESLRQSEELFRHAFENASIGVCLVSLDGRLLKVNSRMTEIFGFSQSEFEGMSVREIAHPDYKDVSHGYIDKAVSGEVVRGSFEKKYLHKDGREIWGLVTSSLIRDSRGNPLYFISHVKDITRAKKAEEKIKDYSDNLERMVEGRTTELHNALKEMGEGRDRIDAILESVADGLIVADMEGRVILMNRAAEKIFGVGLEEVVKKPVDLVITEERIKERITYDRESNSTEYAYDLELPGDEEGKPRIMRARTSDILDKDGAHSGSVTIIHDITRERELDRIKTEFISTAAHELRTPLTSIQGFSEILIDRKDISRKESEKFLAYINEQSLLLSKIINDLLDISRIEADRGFVLEKSWSPVREIVEEALGSFREQSPGYSFDVALRDDDMAIYVDRGKMTQVLKNLLSNAIKYSPNGGIITISGEVKGEECLLTVEDQGLGMAEDQVVKVFDKFYRVDASDKAVPGTGLGMTIVKNIVEAHDGRVWIDSEPGKGTEVNVAVPVRAFGEHEDA